MDSDAKLGTLKLELDRAQAEVDTLHATSTDTEGAVRTAHAERDRLKSEVVRLEEQVKSLNDVSDKFDEQKRENSKISTQLADIKGEHSVTLKTVDRLTTENKKLSEELASLNSLKDLLSAAETKLKKESDSSEKLQKELEELRVLKTELTDAKKQLASLKRENEQLILEHEENSRKFADYDKFKTENEKLREDKVLADDELDKLEETNNKYRKTIKVQEEDLDKLEIEVSSLKKEISSLTTKNKELSEDLVKPSHSSAGAEKFQVGIKEKDEKITDLEEKNRKLEAAAKTLAQQVTQLCDRVEKAQELEELVNKLDGENEQLANDIKALEKELDARETEIENVLADNQTLVVKLNAVGITVEFTEKGIKFTESTPAPSARAQAVGRRTAAARENLVSSDSGSTEAPAKATPKEEPIARPKEGKGETDVSKLMSTMSIDDLLG